MEWPPVRRFSHSDRRNKLGVIKGFTKHRHEKRLPASKHVILEDDESLAVPGCKERDQLLWEKVQSQNRLRKQEAGHVEQIAKLEADATKQRAMLQSVREQLV